MQSLLKALQILYIYLIKKENTNECMEYLLTPDQPILT